MEKKLKALENRIGYEFRNRNLLILALTHSSYANEKKLGKAGCNERLEFLGDAVLELISSDFLYKKFTQIPEGELTKKPAWFASPVLLIVQEISDCRSICSLEKVRT